MGQGALFMIVQQAGAIAASCVVYLLLPGELAVGTVLARMFPSTGALDHN